jgi:hypothetical protein
MRDVVFRSSVKFGGREMVKVGFVDVGSGGVRTTYKRRLL